MYARNASGRNISLLNEPEQSSSSSSRGSSTEAPYTPPELQHTDSYDSSPRSAPISPSTPVAQYDYYRSYNYHHNAYACGVTQPTYDEYVSHHEGRQHRSFSGSARSASYDGEFVPAPDPPPKKTEEKRYPCRFRISHGCDKTFTTSGHASRHSKIHTAEKGVPCSHEGCPKKFTRADNMKQHLETHFKDKSRKGSSSGSSRRSTHPSRSAHRHSRSAHRARAPPRLDVEAYSPVAAPLVSPATGAWDLRALNAPLVATQLSPSPRAGLDALAMAAAHQNHQNHRDHQDRQDRQNGA
ncbi:hypothetical protein VUR80DRAFT_8454 [Thermomyces stellatus]